MMGTDGPWTQVTCAEREALVGDYSALVPSHSLTDHSGQYGSPIVFTEWAWRADGAPALQDYRYPSREHDEPDVKSCEHFAMADDTPASA